MTRPRLEVRLAWLDLADFRSYPSLHWEPDPEVNVIVGPNGAGKTNLLEAIGYLATLRSLRGVGDDAVVRSGETVCRGERRGRAAAIPPHLVELEVSARGRNRVLVNKRRPNRVADLLGEVRAVTFLPDDLDLVKRGPAHRRQLLDDLAVQLAPTAALDLSEYDRALRQRNSLLRQSHGRDPDPVTLAVWDTRMSQAGARVVLRRRAAMAAIAAHVIETYEQLAGERTEIGMSYQTTWGDGDDESSLAHGLWRRRWRSPAAPTASVAPPPWDRIAMSRCSSSGSGRRAHSPARVSSGHWPSRCGWPPSGRWPMSSASRRYFCWTTCSPNST